VDLQRRHYQEKRTNARKIKGKNRKNSGKNEKAVSQEKGRKLNPIKNHYSGKMQTMAYNQKREKSEAIARS